jgi:hypothetical protein
MDLVVGQSQDMYVSPGRWDSLATGVCHSPGKWDSFGSPNFPGKCDSCGRPDSNDGFWFPRLKLGGLRGFSLLAEDVTDAREETTAETAAETHGCEK